MLIEQLYQDIRDLKATQWKIVYNLLFLFSVLCIAIEKLTSYLGPCNLDLNLRIMSFGVSLSVLLVLYCKIYQYGRDFFESTNTTLQKSRKKKDVILEQAPQIFKSDMNKDIAGDPRGWNVPDYFKKITVIGVIISFTLSALIIFKYFKVLS